MIDWPDDLIEDLASRRAVLFLGAGVSKNAKNRLGVRPKDWREYLTSVASEISDPGQRNEVEMCIQEWDLLTACELSRRFLRPDAFKRHLLQQFSDPGFQPTEIHDSLIKVDSRFVLTTNFDKLYENRANQIQENTVLVKHYYDTDVADILRRSQRAVLKVHGTIDSPERTIFTRSAYASARTAFANFYRLLDALFVTHTFIFLGASLRDPDIQMILEDHRYRFEGARPHYIVMPRDSVRPTLVSIMEESMNLRALLYDPRNHHEELALSLKELAPLVEAQRNNLILSRNW